MLRRDLVTAILERPDARLILDGVSTTLQAEQIARYAFHEWLPDDVKAEFINGQVIISEPYERKHLRAGAHFATLLFTFVQLNNLGEVDTEKAMVSLTRNDYEPDICFWRKEVADTFDDEMMQHPAPDLVIEILSKSTAKRDRGVKFEDYAAHGVRGYWLIDPTR